MTRPVKRVKRFLMTWFLIGGLVGLSIFAFYQVYISEPKPYDSVVLNVDQSGWLDGDLMVVANFVKNGACIYEDSRMFALMDDGSWHDYAYFDAAERPSARGSEDRMAGEHTLMVGVVDLEKHWVGVQVLEYRSRHTCRHNEGFVKSDQIFFRLVRDEMSGKPTIEIPKSQFGITFR